MKVRDKKYNEEKRFEKVTAEPIKEVGIEKIIVPEHERRGSMIIEFYQYDRNRRI